MKNETVSHEQKLEHLRPCCNAPISCAAANLVLQHGTERMPADDSLLPLGTGWLSLLSLPSRPLRHIAALSLQGSLISFPQRAACFAWPFTPSRLLSNRTSHLCEENQVP